MLPESGVGGMQESCLERQVLGTGAVLEGPAQQDPPTWTPEDFLQSTLHEGEGEVCPLVVGRQSGADRSLIDGVKPPRARRRQQWKLKFHHQALPPEYLDHYEASLSKAMEQRNPSPECPPMNPLAGGPPAESIHTWLQRITNIQNEIQRNGNVTETHIPSIPVPVKSASSTPRRRRAPAPKADVNDPPTTTKIVNYRDLPYMGEMTLNNSKPRRGRKPKKADICHLIYKNYGTIFPGTPGHLVDERLGVPSSALPTTEKSVQVKKEKVEKLDHNNMVAPNKRRTDLQNKIISSLLEKRLSQENKRNNCDIKPERNKRGKVEEENVAEAASLQMKPPACPPASPQELEPLNLCVRDLNNLKIRLLRKHGNVYTKADVETKIEPEDEEEHEPIHKMNAPDFMRALRDIPSPACSEASVSSKQEPGADSPLPGGYVYWPNAGVFVHPLALQSQLLYYRGLAAGDAYTLPPPDRESPETGFLSARQERSPPVTETESRSSPGGSSSNSVSIASGSRTKRAAPKVAPTKPPAKRKRSAIFIPPVPSEIGSSPATEVSICKFKFTGGARPSLQEKKMLSVDAGGNFRYYSGTGDKASRGYEFFPRESMQQSTSAAGVGAGRGGVPLPPPSPAPAASPPADASLRKRKSRKSLQREKLEQTFKEKGFLIQTQQLESAEGATYCKFRQLRKFTRYLFRSWKDYLPGAIREGEAPDRAPAPPPPPPLPPPPAHADWPS